MAVLQGPPPGHLSASGGAAPLRREARRAGLPLLALALLAGGGWAKEAPAAGTEPAEPFAAEARAWRGYYNKRFSEKGLLFAALKDDKAAQEAVIGKFDAAVQAHQIQLRLYKSLVRNQKEALKDGVLTKEVFDRHMLRLDRSMDERLYYLWGHSLAADWNDIISKLPQGKRLSMYPFPVHPSQEDWDRFHFKEYTPVYEKAERRMKTVKPDEAGPMGGEAR